MDNQLIPYLKKHLSIGEDEETVIKRAFLRNFYKSGEVIATASQLATHLYFIDQGLVKYVISAPDGEQSVLSFIETSKMFGLRSGIPLLSGNEELVAATDCEILLVDDERRADLYKYLSHLKVAFHKILMLELAAMLNTKASFHGQNALEKYKRLLDKQPAVARLASQIDIASYLDITPQSLSRIRKNLRSSAKKSAD